AIARRVTPDAEPKLTKETAFHTRTSALTQRFTKYNGFWLPTAYDNHGAVDEYWACRERAAIMDLSPLRKWEVLGPDAEELLQSTMTRDIRRLADGQVVYTALCNDTGGMIDDGTVFRLQPTNFRFVGGSEYDGVWLREQADRLGLNVWIKESTDELHNVAVQGPTSRDLLAPLIWTAPAQTPFEARIGFTVTKDKGEDFSGKEALLERRAHPQRVLVGLELAGNEPASHGECVHVGRHQVGVITSGTRSPVLKKNIALCRMNIRY